MCRSRPTRSRPRTAPDSRVRRHRRGGGRRGDADARPPVELTAPHQPGASHPFAHGPFGAANYASTLTAAAGAGHPVHGKNHGPGRRITESLTSNPRVREQPGPAGDIRDDIADVEINAIGSRS